MSISGCSSLSMSSRSSWRPSSRSWSRSRTRRCSRRRGTTAGSARPPSAWCRRQVPPVTSACFHRRAWRTAAIHAPWERLSAVAETLVFDAPAPVVSAEQLLDALAHWRPTPRQRQLPPEPQLVPGANPLELRRARREQRRERLTLQAESLFQGEPSVDLTDMLRAMPWSAAAQLLADTLASGRDPVVPTDVVIGDGLLADPVLEVAWCSTPLTLSRSGSSTANVQSSERAEVQAE